MSTQTPSFSTPPSLVAHIARLPELPMAEIKALWRRLVGGEVPTHNRQFLERRLAYRLQEAALRQVEPHLLERNKQRIQALVEHGEARKGDRRIRLMPGTVLSRAYQGIEHRVTVAPDGQYEYAGRRYPSLSMIAREITGTRWSGPLFFGVKAPVKAKQPKKKRGGRR